MQTLERTGKDETRLLVAIFSLKNVLGSEEILTH